MTTLIDFSSLFQLGFGTGIALGLFQAPIKLRLNPLQNSISNDLIVLRDSGDAQVQSRLLSIQTLQIKVAMANTTIERKQRPALVSSVVVGFINLILLIWASLDADMTVDPLGEVLLIGLSVVSFIIILVWMEFLVLDNITPLINEYNDIT